MESVGRSNLPKLPVVVAIERMLRNPFLWIGILLIGVSTLLAWLQPLRPSVYDEPEIFSAGWWLYPGEENAWTRLPYQGGMIFDLRRASNSGRYWAVGTDGLIISSPDGKAWLDHPVCLDESDLAWARLSRNTRREDRCQTGFALAQNHVSVFAWNEATIFVGGDRAILRTLDSGVTWSLYALPADIDDPEIVEFLFADASTGWAFSDEGALFTEDGGQRWRRTPLIRGTTDSQWFDVFSFDNGQAWAVGDAGIASTTDGGRSWRLAAPPTAGTEDLSGVFFLDPFKGWLVGDEGGVWKTENGGSDWQLATASINEGVEPFGILFQDESVGWTHDQETGQIYVTSDGGSTWTPAISPAIGEHVRLWRDPADQSLWAVGSPLARLEVQDFLWSFLLLTPGNMPSELFFDDDTIVGLSTSGDRLESRDGGRSWLLAHQNTNIPDRFANIRSSRDGRVALAEGVGIGIVGPVQSLDRGETWDAIGPDDQITSFFLDATTGWLVDRSEKLFFTSDAGGNWQPVSPDALYNRTDDFFGARRLYFSNALDGWRLQVEVELGDGSSEEPIISMVAYSTTDGGATWSAAALDAPDVRQLQASDPAGFFLTTEGRLFVATRDHAGLKERTDAPDLRTFTFLPAGDVGWGLGADGTIYRTTDLGRTWQEQYVFTGGILTNLDFGDRNRGCAWGRPGLMVCTRDGGATWFQTLNHERSPAPWYYLALLVGIATIGLGIRSRRQLLDQSVAEMLVPDRPLEATDVASKALWPLAAGLSRFLRNASTRPPLTLAVTGEWGSGKSSLMNLLCADLKQHAFHPVWFNVWHHQQEEKLLAALLENIRLQAVPSFWQRGGLAFRWRLLWVRGRRLWLLALLLLFSSAAFTGYFLANPAAYRQVQPAIEAVGDSVSWIGLGESEEKKGEAGEEESSEGEAGKAGKDQAEDEIAAGEAGDEEAGQSEMDKEEEAKGDQEQLDDARFLARLETAWTKPAIGWLVSAVLLLGTAVRFVTAFGLDPAKLVASMSTRLGVRGYRDKLGFRYLFKQEFRDVTRALQPRNMVIVIDDLDRCRPEKVLEILESINFLVSCGECVVILGIDFDRVQEFVRRGFVEPGQKKDDQKSDEAGKDETGEAESGKEESDDSNAGLEEARHYLRKLINIEIPVPALDDEAYRQLIAAASANAADSAPDRLQFWGHRLRRLAPLVIATFALAAGLYLGTRAPAGDPIETGSRAAIRPAAPPVTANAKAANDQAADQSVDQANRSVAADRAVADQGPVFAPGEPASTRFGHAGWILLLGVGFLIWRIRSMHDIEQDSRTFTSALETWRPLLFATSPSPREAKRFLNRLRYYAMMQRRTEQDTPWQKLLEKLGVGGEEQPPVVEHEIPEDILVALGALQHYRPVWLEDEALYADLGGYLRDREVPAELTKNLDAFSKMGSLVGHRDAFRSLVAGLRL